MDAQHKNLLRENRSKLVDEMQDIKTIVNKLYEKKTITNAMVEQILEGNNITTDKKRALLDMLPRRGPNAFEEFINVLIECQEWDAADCLRPGAGRSAEISHKSGPQVSTHVPIVTTPVEEDLPMIWPDDRYSPLSIHVKKVDPQDQNMQNKFVRSTMSYSGYYCLQKNPRGKLVIINNENFSDARKNKLLNLADREGTNMDATSIQLLFKELSFTVETCRNLTASEITNELKRVSEQDHTNYDCFVCFVLSHGTGTGVYGVDGEVANIQVLTDLFNSQNCQSLVGKPKLFFIQACQGTKADTGSAGATAVLSSGQQESVPDDDISLKKARMAQDEMLHSLEKLSVDDTKADAQSEENVPTRADIFVAFATTPDFLSYRNTERGTWFVQAISYIFQKYAFQEELNSLMTKVNLLVSRGVIQGKGHKQVSNYNSSFRKKFYFFPGLSQESGQQHHYNQVHPSS